MKQIYVQQLVLKRALAISACLMLCIASGLKAQVSGLVFRDYDLNGIRSDTLPAEVGVVGVTVRAFVDLSKTPVLTTTGADGSYSFASNLIPAGKPIRIEFDNLPTGDYNGPFGPGSGTSVQFVKSPATNVNLGINYPSDYCQSTSSGVWLVTPCYVNGNPLTTLDEAGNLVPDDKQTAKSDALVAIDYKATGILSPSNFPPNHLAVASQVGSLWALAYQRRAKKLFGATVIKRHMGFGPLGSGGIYVTDMATNTTSGFIDVRTIGIDTGNDPHNGMFGNKTMASTDPGSMSAMGRVSFGGMSISEDDKTLYFVNLKDRKLYGLSIGFPAHTPSAADVKSWAIPDPGCSNGDFRPWAVKMYHGKLYIGVVCSAETSQQQSDLRATIYRFDPTAASPVFETVLSFPLDFRRGPADNTYDPAVPENTCLKYDHWLPWTDAWPTPCGLGTNPAFVMYPQPILSDLEFDEQGSMLIGFMDRFGHLAGLANHDPQGNGFYDGFTGGDLLKAYNNKGTFELEKNGKAGNQTGSGVGNNQGPVDASGTGGEFFGNDFWMFLGHVGHAEVTNGALSTVPGYREIATSAFDPIAELYQSAGLKMYNSYTGATNRNFVIYAQTPGTFGKAAGLGDNTALCDAAPVEIGNRVWFDDNRDGIQNAYEPGIDGIAVTLHDMENDGIQLASQTTHDGGQFYFNNTTVPTGLKFDHRYEIRVDTTQLPLLDITLNGTKPITPAGGRLAAQAGARVAAAGTPRHYTVSPINRTDGNTDPGLRDSDARVVGSSAVIAITTRDAGQNDFTFDLSIYSCPELTNERDTITVCAGASVGSIAADGKHLSRVDSVRFVLFTSPQSGTAMYSNTGTVLGTVYPDSTGRIVLPNPAINTVNVPRQYVYATIYPIPENPACRQSDGTIIDVIPGYSVSALGGELTCSVESLTLTGTARNSDGSLATEAIYYWTGPNNFTSSAQNPVVTSGGNYTLSVSRSNCPAVLTGMVTQVMSNTATPTVSTSLVAKTCPTCLATLSATAGPDATYSWTGPDGFTSTNSVTQAAADGTYVVTVTGSNSCRIAANLFVVPFDCPPALTRCLPLVIRRAR